MALVRSPERTPEVDQQLGDCPGQVARCPLLCFLRPADVDLHTLLPPCALAGLGTGTTPLVVSGSVPTTGKIEPLLGERHVRVRR